MIGLYLECRGAEFARGELPFAGGIAEQPCLLMDAFAHIGSLWAASEPKPKPAEERQHD